MYTPTITASPSQSTYLSNISRAYGCDSGNLVTTMKCLYNREFRPLYMEQYCNCYGYEECDCGVTDCNCVTCYDIGVWGQMVKHSSFLNKNLIWNDIIKRWEPTSFDQNFSENVNTNSGYEFRTYEDVYEIKIDEYYGTCDDTAFEETSKGSGFESISKNA